MSARRFTIKNVDDGPLVVTEGELALGESVEAVEVAAADSVEPPADAIQAFEALAGIDFEDAVEAVAIAMCETGKVEWEVQEDHRKDHFRLLARSALTALGTLDLMGKNIERRKAAKAAAEGPPKTPRERAERVLGHAVHPAALDRLFDLWPEAHVFVMHGDADAMVAGEHTRGTWVTIQSGAQPPFAHKPVRAEAKCNPWDQFNRETGIRIAFNRALKKVPR